MSLKFSSPKELSLSNLYATKPEQSIKLEAILKKLGFHKPSRMDLQDFALNDLSLKNKEDNKDYGHERWKDYTYRIDLAKQYDEEKYGKNNIKSRSNH